MHVVIGFSTRGKDISDELLMWILNQGKDGTHVSIITSRHGHSSRKAQHGLFNAIQRTDADYGLFLDSDVVPKGNIIERMMRYKKDIVVAPVWHYDEHTKDIHVGIHPTDEAGVYGRPHHIGYGLSKVDAASFSCVLVSRKVLDTFNDRNESAVIWSPLIPEEYKERNNDNVFFAKCKALGFDVWCDWEIETVHHRTIELSTKTLSKFFDAVTLERSVNPHAKVKGLTLTQEES